MSRRNFFGSGPLGGAQPTARLAGQPRPRLAQAGGIGCKVPGTETRPVFQLNPTTGVCGVFNVTPSTAPYPDCVQAPPDYPGGGYNGWIPPSCAPTSEPTPTPTPGLPPGLACPMGNGLFTLLNYATGEVIAENITRDQFSQYTDNVTDLPADQSCSDDSRCAPICNVSVVEPPYYGEPPAVPSCCTTYWDERESKWFVQCETTKPDGTSVGYEGAVDTLPAEYWDLCAPAVAPTPAPAPVPVSPPVTQVSPGAPVPIVPGPFPSAPPAPSIPISSGPMPGSAPPPIPQRGFAPATISPLCKVVPYKTRMFSPTTVPTRPDEFTEKQQWTT
jgi:hypothetical protein